MLQKTANFLGITAQELFGILIILLAISTFAFFNLRNSVLLARDVQRKNDLKHIASALTDYTNKIGGYPNSMDGKILRCGESLSEPCRWGIDPLVASDSAKIMDRLPNDPLWREGAFYLYRSNKRDYQLYASLEDESDSEFNREIKEKGFMCGSRVCNFGIASGNTTLFENIQNNIKD